MSFCCFADWIDYGKKLLLYVCLSSDIFQRVKGVHNSIVLVVSLLVAIIRTR